MKNLLLSALFLGTVLTASAQSGGYSVSPLGAGPGDAITLTVDPAVACNAGTPGLAGATAVRIHSGVKTAAGRWQSVVAADGNNDNIVGFTQNSNGTWSKTFTSAAAYYGVAAADIEEIDLVLNGGPATSIWDLKAAYQDPNDPAATCGDLFIPFPIAAPFGVVATKHYINNAFSLRAARPNPTSGESAIHMTLKQSGNVVVSVKNLLGQTVATLANGFETAGEKSFSWNSSNANAGIYFYTVESAGNTASAKIQVVK